MKHCRTILFMMLPLLMQACGRLEETNYQAATSLNTWKNDTGRAWEELLTYHPKSRALQAAATRYCYQFSSDIVCYDAPQPQLTAPLVGVQGSEGPRMVVYQSMQAPAYQTAEPQPLFEEPQATVTQPVPFGTAKSPAKTVESKELPPPASAKSN